MKEECAMELVSIRDVIRNARFIQFITNSVVQ